MLAKRVVPRTLLLTIATSVLLLSAFMISPSRKVFAAACTTPSTDYGTVTQTVSIPTTGTYLVLSRMMADSANAANDSYLLEIDGANCYNVGGTGVSNTAWDWVDYRDGNTATKVTQSLTAGNHTIKMIGNAPNVKLDRVIFTGDLSCVPTGTGDNCANPPDTTPPTVSISSPTNGATVGTSVTVNVTASDDVAISKVELRDNGTLVGTDTTGPTYSFSLTNLSVGSHALVARAYDTAATPNTANSTTITVNVPDTTAPTITSIQAGSITQTSATITWTTNEASDTQVDYGTTTSLGQSTTLNSSMVTSHSASITGLNPSTQYYFRVKSKDAAGNSTTSPVTTGAPAAFTTLAPAADTTKPTVNMTAPANGSTATGSVTVTATASDNVGVAGVQFLLDGANLGTEDTLSPYSITWNTSGVSNGTHTLSARARDAAGNVQTSATITVTVNNPVASRPEDINQDGIVSIKDFGALLAKYGQSGAGLGRADINGDGIVSIKDFGLLLAQYGK